MDINNRGTHPHDWQEGTEENSSFGCYSREDFQLGSPYPIEEIRADLVSVEDMAPIYARIIEQYRAQVAAVGIELESSEPELYDLTKNEKPQVEPEVFENLPTGGRVRRPLHSFYYGQPPIKT